MKFLPNSFAYLLGDLVSFLHVKFEIPTAMLQKQLNEREMYHKQHQQYEYTMDLLGLQDRRMALLQFKRTCLHRRKLG